MAMVEHPNTMVDLPNTIVDLANTMVDLPNRMEDLPNTIVAEMDKLLESSKSLSLNLQALSSKLGLVQNEIQA